MPLLLSSVSKGVVWKMYPETNIVLDNQNVKLQIVILKMEWLFS
jgi:hypothetical protein